VIETLQQSIEWAHTVVRIAPYVIGGVPVILTVWFTYDAWSRKFHS